MILINGQPGDCLDVRDRGLQYGDGLFETIAVRNGVAQQWQRHLQRLQLGCARLRLPAVDEAALAADAEQVCGGVSRGVLKIIVTRGQGGRGYRPPDKTQPTRIVDIYPWPEYPADYASAGVAVHVCQTRLAHNPALAGVKHLNRLEQVLARSEWSDIQIAEGLMLDMAGNVVEGTMTNVFAVNGTRLLSPDLSQCGVAGIARGRLLETAPQQGLQPVIGAMSLADLLVADEVFLSNSIIGIWPVRRITDVTWKAFPVARRLAIALQLD